MGRLIAKYADYVPQFEKRKRTSAQQAGLNFERAVVNRLQSLYTKVEHGPWLYYNAGRGASGICQPDALVWLPDNRLCIVECKLTWVRGAREKLLKFYGPIVQAIHRDAELCYLQAYRNPKKGCHKRTVSLYTLEDELKPGVYKECHAVM